MSESADGVNVLNISGINMKTQKQIVSGVGSVDTDLVESDEVIRRLCSTSREMLLAPAAASIS